MHHHHHHVNHTWNVNSHADPVRDMGMWAKNGIYEKPAEKAMDEFVLNISIPKECDKTEYKHCACAI